MCVYASNQSSSKDFLFKINFAYVTNYIFGDLFSIQVMSLFHEKHFLAMQLNILLIILNFLLIILF